MNGVSSGMRPRKANFQIRSWPKFSNAADPTAFTVQMVEKINRLTAEQAQEIMKPQTGEGLSREQATYDMLEKHLG